jgi:RimJ/RimL family protein N-acetyltransferase
MIEIAGRNDFVQIASLLIKANREEAKKYHPELEVGEEELEAVVELLHMVLDDQGRGVVYCFKKDGDIGGFIFGHVRGNRGFIQDIWLDRYFSEKGMQSIACSTAVDNLPVHIVLEKKGFEPISMSYIKGVEE